MLYPFNIEGIKTAKIARIVKISEIIVENPFLLPKINISKRKPMPNHVKISLLLFGGDAPVRYGLKEGVGTYYVLKFALDEALMKKNYPVEKCKTGFFERGYMKMHGGKRQTRKKQGGITSWYYVVEVPYDEGLHPLSGDDSE